MTCSEADPQIKTSRGIDDGNFIWSNKPRAARLEMNLLAIDRLPEFSRQPTTAPALRAQPAGPARLDQS